MLPKDLAKVDLGDLGEYFPKWGFQNFFPMCRHFWVVQRRVLKTHSNLHWAFAKDLAFALKVQFLPTCEKAVRAFCHKEFLLGITRVVLWLWTTAKPLTAFIRFSKMRATPTLHPALRVYCAGRVASSAECKKGTQWPRAMASAKHRNTSSTRGERSWDEAMVMNSREAKHKGHELQDWARSFEAPTCEYKGRMVSW